MNTNKFRERIFDKWGIKVMCLVVAIIVYFLHQFSILDTKTFSIPVDIQAYGMMIPSELKNHNVKVTVRGKSEELSAILESDLQAYLDITSVTKEGEVNVPVIIMPSQRLSILDPLEINVKPDKIKIDVQLREERYVPVKPVIAGECGYGYEVGEIKAEPSEILISGPRKMVESIVQINTEKVDVSDCRKTTVQETVPRNQNKLITLESLESIKVTVEIKEIETVKQFVEMNIACTKLPENLEAEEIKQKAQVILSGTLLNLERIKPSSITINVDCSSITEPGEYELPVSIKAPYYVSIQSNEPETVMVIVTEKTAVPEETAVQNENHHEGNIIQ